MTEAASTAIHTFPDVIIDIVVVISGLLVEYTWWSFVLTLTLTYFAYHTLLWQWRVGQYGQRHVLVTGCDTGFGFELVQRLDSLGFRVFAGCLTSEGVERVTKATSRRVTPLSLDVTDSSNIREVVDCMAATIPASLVSSFVTPPPQKKKKKKKNLTYFSLFLILNFGTLAVCLLFGFPWTANTQCVLDFPLHYEIFFCLNYFLLPGLWAVINNAGIMPSMAPLELTPRDCFQRTLAVNLTGTVEVTRACLPLVRRSRGRIINMSSVSGRLGFVAMDYTVSKFAVEGFSDCLRREVYSDGIKVSTITPGGFQTGLCNFDTYFSSMQRVMGTLEPEVQQHYGKDYVTSLQRIRPGGLFSPVQSGGTHFRFVCLMLSPGDGCSALKPFVRVAGKTIFDLFLRHCSWGSSSLQCVVEAYLHAISARYPRRRYVVGVDATLLFHPLSCLPDWVGDFVFTTWPFSLLLK
ncbi:17-beta-hydroxysteroid dehydrogenase type 6-like [Littorina saxatilis]|uniref:17-beta-hydroxysteroid dehydrogenase type 6-like n=1 Tax=Littorina saxatilis TaxID=31220 RepID=UPI0038B5B630